MLKFKLKNTMGNNIYSINFLKIISYFSHYTHK